VSFFLHDFEFIKPVPDVPEHNRAVFVDLLKISADQARVFDEYLDEFEQQRLQKITIAEKRHAFRACRFVVKQLIGEFCGADPQTLTFEYSDRGKPYISSDFQKTPVHFNISHSGDYALIGVSHLKIGVDIECMKSHRNFKKLAASVLSDVESKWVFEQDSVQRFYTLWALKEARLKCDGGGLEGAFPEAMYDAHTGWGFENYQVLSGFINNNYAYNLCFTNT
jgi:4'-phosphopantetheinyl transferase